MTQTKRQNSHLRIRMLCEGAIMVALAQILSYIKLMELPNGGSLTPAMFPIILFAIRWGWKDGLLAGFTFGLLQLIFDGAYAWGWQSMLLDYLVAFTPLGLAGLFRGKKWGIFAGTVVGCAGRFLVHYISGVTIYKILAPTEFMGTTFTSPEFYSLVYNGVYMLPNTVIALIIAGVLYYPLKNTFWPKIWPVKRPFGPPGPEGGKEDRMGKFDGVLLVSDYDDTLISWDLVLSEKNKEAIRYFTGEGGRFSVATGRGYSTFVKQSKEVPLNAPCVLSNGASIYDFQADKSVYESFLSAPEALQCLAEVMERFPDVACEAYHGAEIYAWNPNVVTERHMERVSGTYTLCPPNEMPQPWSKLLLEEDHVLLKKVQHYVRTQWGEHFEAIFSNRYLLEMTHKDCHKGGMVLRLADHLGISRERIYCVGDNQNDIPMLAVSAIPFAPANCVQEVRDWGAKLVASCNDSCIAEIVDILDHIY